MASSTSSLLPEQPKESSPPSLENLVAHLLAAKRSLSCVEHVYQANDIVIKTRYALEEQTRINASTIFLQNGSSAQIELLSHVLNHTQSISQEGESDFKAVIRVLDAAESRLQQILDQLRSTVVEPSLRPDEETRKTLNDFVDESGVQGLLSTIKESIDAAGDARRTLDLSNAAFDEEISRARSLLEERSGQPGLEQPTDGLLSPVPEILQGMEAHAREMADNLESLVKHFDICVTAIKHTEGGGAAVLKITSDLPEGVSLDLNNEDLPLEPLGEEERLEMLTVLEKDAGEVEEVVMDIRDRAAEMEAKFERVHAYTEYLKERHDHVTTAFRLLENLGGRLTTYIAQSHIFLSRWEEEKAKIVERMEELESLREFYDGFSRAYDKLIIEIGRRKTMEVKLAKVAQDALAKIERLHAEEVAERNAFKQEQGDFLPVDIWPGLMMEPIRYKISREEESVSGVPDISSSVIQRSIRRVTGKK